MPSDQFRGGWVQPHWVPAVIGCSFLGVGSGSGGFSPTGCRRSSGAPSWGWGRGRGRVGSAPLRAGGHRVLLPGGGVGVGVGWVQPHWVPAVIADPPSGRLTHRHGYEGIENSNPMVTERYITRITVSRQEPSGQVAAQAAAAWNREPAGDDRSRKAPMFLRVVSVRNEALTAGAPAL